MLVKTEKAVNWPCLLQYILPLCVYVYITVRSSVLKSPTQPKHFRFPYCEWPLSIVCFWVYFRFCPAARRFAPHVYQQLWLFRSSLKDIALKVVFFQKLVESLRPAFRFKVLWNVWVLFSLWVKLSYFLCPLLSLKPYEAALVVFPGLKFILYFRVIFQVSRSTALLRSLSVERQRWETSSNAFQTQMGTIVGDVLLSSAFLAYAGQKKIHTPRAIIFATCFELLMKMQFKGSSQETKIRTTMESFLVSEVYYKIKRFLLISSKFVLCRERGQNLVLRFNGGPLNTRPVFVNVSRLQLLRTKTSFVFFRLLRSTASSESVYFVGVSSAASAHPV